LLLNLEQDIRKSNQAVNFASEPCYTIGTSAEEAQHTIYCYVAGSKHVTRNGVVVATNIDRFRLTSNTALTIITVDVETVPDARNQTFEITYTIYLRQ
jgi:hypothetical protein